MIKLRQDGRAHTPPTPSIFAVAFLFAFISHEAIYLQAQRHNAMQSHSATSSRPEVMQIEKGTWGGQHIGLEITDSGATIEFDCAHGTVDQRIEGDSNGVLDLRGTYVRESPGPARQGDREDSHPARYTGRVEGKSMTITIRLTDTGETVGTFKLSRGALPKVFKCG